MSLIKREMEKSLAIKMLAVKVCSFDPRREGQPGYSLLGQEVGRRYGGLIAG